MLSYLSVTVTFLIPGDLSLSPALLIDLALDEGTLEVPKCPSDL